ncbi:lysine exporter protein [Corynebacterium suranareeae]|uniref:Lysine exporter protein n=1 Tax=Corynebacterium suranareeae TaxID=2506452 RepID=A0A160PQ22_9CORY|nr:L-lysine exporter [Corynebacterium suranareeae]BAU95646.1 lysine exporter protein [Corynebacterium suranareeae]
MYHMGIFITGLLLGASLLLSIGPQNVLVIKQGIKREGLLAVILVCLVSDVFLFTAGTLGVDLLSTAAPIVLDIMRWAGIAYLLWFAVIAAKDAIGNKVEAPKIVEETEPTVPDGTPHGGSAVATDTRSRVRVKVGVEKQRVWVKTMLMAIVLTWLNPNAYLDAFVFIGGVGAQYGETGRWIFAAGAFLASLIWFPLVGYGAAALSRPLSSPKVWRWINVGVAIVMTALAIKLMLLG